MSASYPLVRNLNAFSTRFGVSRSPSRVGSSPISASSRLIRSCIALFYISGSLTLSATPEAESLRSRPRSSARDSLEPLRGASAPGNTGGGGVPAARQEDAAPRASQDVADADALYA